IEDIAALFPEGVKQDGARGKTAEIFKAQGHGGSRLAETRNAALGNDAAIGSQLAIVERREAMRRLFDYIFDACILAPLVEHASIAEAVGPAHPGRGEFLAPRHDGL